MTIKTPAGNINIDYTSRNISETIKIVAKYRVFAIYLYHLRIKFYKFIKIPEFLQKMSIRILKTKFSFNNIGN